MTIAVCPGSFDPVTSGHMDVISRSAAIFDTVHVVVAENTLKSPLFTPERRVFLIREAVKEYGLQNVSVDKTDGLITEFCTKIDASIIVKGLRQNSDYEAELGMALVNKKLSGIETVFMPAEPGRGYISSSIIKDVARFGGDITGMVPNCVIPAMKEVFGKIDSGENRL